MIPYNDCHTKKWISEYYRMLIICMSSNMRKSQLLLFRLVILRIYLLNTHIHFGEMICIFYRIYIYTIYCL